MSSILLFDGPCNLCNKGVQFFLRRDKTGTIQFASLQSMKGQELLRRFKLPVSDFDSLVLVQGGQYWLKSDAIIKASFLLGGAYKLSLVLKIIPKGLRDFMYSRIASNRYRWFGKSDVCFLPDPMYRDRFLS
jgi:predicted DCC family thiol-disulfide oxidoreductase YuxK